LLEVAVQVLIICRPAAEQAELVVVVGVVVIMEHR
jgi:hypothetical protein